jgi:hypothetical protein
MANAATTVTNVNGYTTPIGNRALSVKKVAWNTGNYVAGGLIVYKQTFGLRGIDIAHAPGISAGGNYQVLCQVTVPGANQLAIRLFVAGTEVTAGTALTADSTVLSVIGG